MQKYTEKIGLSYEDILLVPNCTVVSSRSEVDIQSRITRLINIDTPIIASPMSSITESDMAIAMGAEGAGAILHRFNDPSTQFNEYQRFKKALPHVATVGCAVGIKPEDERRITSLLEVGIPLLCIDVANGDNIHVFSLLERIKTINSNVQIIAGSVCTKEGTLRLINAGADAVRVGIGNGSICSTRHVTGVGIPQLSAILECATVAEPHGVPIIADGGLNSSGDIAKAIAAGAGCVMTGRLLASTVEAAGRGLYYGQSSEKANDELGKVVPFPEGVEGEVEVKDSVKNVLERLTWGLKSAISYCGGYDIRSFQDRAAFIQVAAGVQKESATIFPVDT